MRLVELFSGIGSQAKALSNIGVDLELVATCEWNVHALVAYDIIHNGFNLNPLVYDLNKEELLELLRKKGLSIDGKNECKFSTLKSLSEDTLKRIYSSILNTNNVVNIQKLQANDLPNNIDIMTYSFPCQDLSNVGSFHGYNKGIDRDSGSRSGLIWEVERILSEMHESNKNLPKFLLLENVTALMSQRHRTNFREWQLILEGMGYINKVYILNALDFGMPQNRKRLYMISVLANDNNQNVINNYFNTHDLNDSNYRNGLPREEINLRNILKTDYRNEIYLNEALLSQPNDTISRKQIWERNYQLTNQNGEILRNSVATLTTKQDRNPNSGNIYFNPKNNKKSKFRYLTPRECFMLMGFEEHDFEQLISENFTVHNNRKFFTRDNMLKMAGNSIVVNVLEKIFEQICEIDDLINIHE